MTTWEKNIKIAMALGACGGASMWMITDFTHGYQTFFIIIAAYCAMHNGETKAQARPDKGR